MADFLEMQDVQYLADVLESLLEIGLETVVAPDGLHAECERSNQISVVRRIHLHPYSVVYL